MRWTIQLQAQTARLNQLLGDWRSAARLKKRDRAIVALACHEAGVLPAEGRRHVSLCVTLGPRQRAADPDAYFKSLLDALTSCGALRDDSRQWVELGAVTFERGPAASMTVTIEDADDLRRCPTCGQSTD